ncbi:MAG: glutathione S-transferase [Gammaproteobacteria bacterium]|nr:glutathione S-transferase [Gammaproteobacteria bacterium]
MLNIYGRKNSNQVIQLMWTVGELGLEHVRHNVGGSFGGLDTDEYGKLNPNRLVPTIEDNGFVLWESYAIIRYLCRQYGEGSLWPTNPQQAARADQWMEWTNSRFMGTFFPIFWSLIRTPKEEQDLQKISQAAADTGTLLQIVENALEGQQFLAGDHLTMGDIPLGAMMFKYFSLEIERPSLPNIESWYARLCDREAYQEHAMNSFGRSNEEWHALERAGA